MSISESSIVQSLSRLTTALPSEKKDHFYALEALNEQFYLSYADAFHSTREYGWRGWKALIELLEPVSLKVLDIGCGGGRLADFLERIWLKEHGKMIEHYLGLERSPKLLAHAQARSLDIPTTWSLFDWSKHQDSTVNGVNEAHTSQTNSNTNAGFDWVTLFGVMHHIYGFETRVRMIELCTQVLAPGAVLSISLWNFGAQPRYKKKKLDWASQVKQNSGLATECIEDGDFLLGWAGETHIPRYCHWMSPSEEAKFLDQIIKKLPQLSKPIITTIEGDHNRYISWRLN